jgi:hypothetical protein
MPLDERFVLLARPILRACVIASVIECRMYGEVILALAPDDGSIHGSSIST